MPTKPAPSRIKEVGSGTLPGMFIDNRLPVLPVMVATPSTIEVVPFVVNNTFRLLLVKSNVPPLFVMSKVKLNAPAELNDKGPAVRTKQAPLGTLPLTHPPSES